MGNYKNESCERIFKHVATSHDIDESEKRTLIHYATMLYMEKIENIKNISLKDYLFDLRKIYKYLGESELNSVTKERVMRLYHFLKICDQYSKSEKKIDDELLEELSYKLDLLYLDSGLSPREKSSFSYTLTKDRQTEVKNEKNR